MVSPDGKDDARDHSGRQGRCAWLFRAAMTMRVVIPAGKDGARGYSGRLGRCARFFRLISGLIEPPPSLTTIGLNYFVTVSRIILRNLLCFLKGVSDNTWS